MPLYEFECTSCGNISEKLMKISEPNPAHCEHCQGGPLKKLMSRTSFVLKGQGWYETDFKNKSTASETPKAKKKATCEAQGCDATAAATCPNP